MIEDILLFQYPEKHKLVERVNLNIHRISKDVGGFLITYPRANLMSQSEAGREDLIERARTVTLFRNAPNGVVMSCLIGCIAAAMMAFDDPSIGYRALGWAIALIACMAYHLVVCRVFERSQSPAPVRWTNAFTLAAVFEGLCWGVGAFLFASGEQYHRQLVFLVLASGMVAATAFVFSTNLRPFRAFFYLAILPQLAVQIFWPYPLHWLASVMTAAFVLSIAFETERANSQSNDVLRLRFENEALAVDLRVQKGSAEAANAAKSNFLAAASHDLRQPVHALGLFVGALRTKRMHADARQLVEDIGDSVAALDDLFVALLDISRLDAGVVLPDLAPVPIAPLIGRLARDYAAEAVAKGLRLTAAGRSAVVTSDPVLLERVLRNLLSNAVRYTDAGRVLIACRRRADRLAIEIRDTGRGISEIEQARIFDEFYQVDNPERDREKGLGLGLAIVRRLCALIGATLECRSAVGRGSLFRVTLPLAEAGVAAARSDNDAIRPPAISKAALILVIDDEASVCRATAALLTSWGHRTIVARGVEDALTQAEAQPPDLIICDYRLSGSATGIDAIDALRRSHDRAIPAMLVTGDTAPDRIVEATASGLLLLHKPVARIRLRAAVGNLLRATMP